jgi:predicted ATP-grasp superfamily ATP-dependent carboligase
MGLDIARSLGRRGIPVYGLDPDPTVAGAKSKHCQLVVCPDPRAREQAFLAFMEEWGRRIGRRAVLYPVSDDLALLCSRERQRLEPYYEYVAPEHQTMVNLSTKAGLAATAQRCGIPAPQTIIPRDTADVQEAARHLVYPAILKPVESAYWHVPEIAKRLRQNALSSRAKAILCQDASELARAYRNIAAQDDRVVIQEVIPGPDENLAYISFYLDRQSRPLALFAGRKLRIIPVGFGSASYVRSFRDPDLEHIALELLSKTHYQGLGGIEFKRDARDGHYKLIEFNARFGMWDGLAIRCGIDTPYIAYRDALSLPVSLQRTYREGIIWLDWQRDLRAFWMYRSRGELTLRKWLRSLRGEKMWAVYSKDDWRPGVAFTLNLVRAFWKRIVSGRSQGETERSG